MRMRRKQLRKIIIEELFREVKLSVAKKQEEKELDESDVEPLGAELDPQAPQRGKPPTWNIMVQFKDASNALEQLTDDLNGAKSALLQAVQDGAPFDIWDEKWFNESNRMIAKTQGVMSNMAHLHGRDPWKQAGAD